MKSWPTLRTAVIGARPNTLSWPPRKQASISTSLAHLTVLCCNSICSSSSVPALQAPCRRHGLLLPRRGQTNGSPAVVLRVEVPGESKLFQAVHAGDALGLGFGLGQGRQEHPGQDGDDRNDDQQFNQGEGADREFGRGPGCRF